MAAGSWTWFNRAKGRPGTGTINYTGDTLKLALTTSSQALSATFVGSSTNCLYADLTNEVANGNGYTTGGVTLASVTWTQSTGTWTFDCADSSWTSASFTAKYGVLYDDTASGKPLLLFFELDTGGSVTVTNGKLAITENASGVFTLS